MEYYGLPSMLLFPSSHYRFEVGDDKFELTLPKKGIYKDLDKEYFKGHDAEFKEFVVFDDETNTFYPPAVTTVLLSLKKYPRLSVGEVFMPLKFELKEKDIVIVGVIAKLLSSEGLEEKEA